MVQKIPFPTTERMMPSNPVKNNGDFNYLHLPQLASSWRHRGTLQANIILKKTHGKTHYLASKTLGNPKIPTT